MVRGSIALAVLALLFALLFQYRAGSALNHLAAGSVMPTGNLLALDGASPWVRPLYETINFLHAIWMPFVLGILIAATLIALLPELGGKLARQGAAGSLLGVLFALPNMFCSCCAGPLFAGLYRGGASLEAALSVYVAAPSLNVAVLIVAFSLLPTELALARAILGMLAAGAVAFLAAGISARWLKAGKPEVLPGRGEWLFMRTVGRLLGAYCEFLDLKVEPRAGVSVGLLLSRWVMTVWRLLRVAVPLIFLGVLAVEALLTAGVHPAVTAWGGGLFGVAVVSALGTILMIPSFAEVPLALGLLKAGMGLGPAAAILITAPAVSLPSLLLVGWAVRDHRVGLVLGGLIFLLGVLAGLVFSVLGGP
jgi:hypothetical protein